MFRSNIKLKHHFEFDISISSLVLFFESKKRQIL